MSAVTQQETHPLLYVPAAPSGCMSAQDICVPLDVPPLFLRSVQEDRIPELPEVFALVCFIEEAAYVLLISHYFKEFDCLREVRLFFKHLHSVKFKSLCGENCTGRLGDINSV